MKNKICIRTEGSSTTTNSSSSSSRKAVQNVNLSTRRPPFFHDFSNYSSTSTYVVIVLFVVNERSKLHMRYRHTPVEVAEVRFSGPERGVAAYTRTPEREQTIFIGWPSDISKKVFIVHVQFAAVRAAWHELRAPRATRCDMLK